jgi:DNA invertase Pin-like site-specific DNA recombinase
MGSVTGRRQAAGSLAALRAANDRRTLEASGRNRKLAAAALMRLGKDCPAQLEEVATEMILHSEYPWSEIARRLGLTRHQVVSRFRRLLALAELGEHGSGAQA